MKLILLSACLIMATTAFSPRSLADDGNTGGSTVYDIHFPTLETVNPSNVFSPQGFDANDKAQIVVAGVLPTTCFKSAPPEVKVDKKNFRIHVTAKNYLSFSAWCGSISTPYMEVVDLGMLPQGKYEVVSDTREGRVDARGFLPVAQPSSVAMDEFHYAPVDEISVKKSGGARKALLTLRGTFTSTCSNVEEVRVKYTAPNVIEVLPITDLREGATCEPASRPFQVTKWLDSPWSGSTLIHVRSLSGQSLNKIHEF